MPRTDKDPHDAANQRNAYMRAFSMLSHIGVTVIACIAVAIVTGRFLDNLFGTSPWLLLVLTLLGIVAAFKSILDIANKM